jgi:hypothetical protein
LIDDRSFVAASIGDIESLIDQGVVTGDTAARRGLVAAAGKHIAVLCVDTAKIKDLLGDSIPPEAETFKPLLDAKGAVVTFDTGDSWQAHLQLSFAGAEAAKQGEKALATGLTLLSTAGKAQAAALANDRDRAAQARILGLIAEAVGVAKVARQASDISGSVSLRADPKEVSSALLEFEKTTGTATRQVQGTNKLKQLALAFHNYHSAYGTFPPPAIYDKDGKPLLSWRVLILPFVEENELFKKVHLDEPWDSAWNKKLFERMPAVYLAEVEGGKPGETYYQGFKGVGALFDGQKGKRLRDITDGTSNTFLIVEAGKSVPWAKPEDIPYDAAKPIAKLGFRKDGFLAAFCDGSVRKIPDSTPVETLRAYITPNGGEVIPNKP